MSAIKYCASGASIESGYFLTKELSSKIASEYFCSFIKFLLFSRTLLEDSELQPIKNKTIKVLIKKNLTEYTLLKYY